MSRLRHTRISSMRNGGAWGPHSPNVSGRGLSEPRSGWHFFLDRLFHIFLLNLLGTEGPGMFNVTSPQEVGDDAEHRPPDGEYHRIIPDRQDELELGPVNSNARCYKDIHPANQRDDAEEWVEPHAIGTFQVGLPAA